MDSFWQAVTEHNWEQPEVKIEFRLYYDKHGNVICYSMEDLPGNYIAIDRVTFEQTRFDIKVKDGKIIKVSNPASWKLFPASTETMHRCHPDDVCIVVSKDYETPHYWEVKTTHDAD